MAQSSSQFRLITLGRCAVESGDGEGDPTPVFGVGKPFALLAYLAATPRRTLTREHLLDLLWPDSDPDRGRNALRQLTWLVRHRLGESSLASDGDSLTLSSEISSDREDFLAAVAGGDTERALDHYAGDYLPDLAMPGGPGFEHWADAERQYLHSAYVRTAELRGRELLDRGRAEEAVAVARRLRDRDPLREASWRLFLEALLAAGKVLSAAAEADALGLLWQAEGRELDRATRALVERARHPGTATPALGAADRLVAVLVGREMEFGTAMRAWRSASGTELQHIRLTGAPGLGKSRLLEDVADRIRAEGGVVAVVRARAGERDVPGAALADLVREVADLRGATGISPAAASLIVALEPSLAPRFAGASPSVADPSEVWRLRSAALRDLIEAVTDNGPVALVFDDVQWMDAESQGAIRHAFERLDDRPLCLFTAARSGYDGESLSGKGITLPLRPLDEGQVAEMLASIALFSDTGIGAGLAAQICVAADGEPLQVLETLRVLDDRELLQLDGDSWRVGDPSAIRRTLSAPLAFAERVARLPADARRLTEILSVAPVPVPVEALPSVTGALPEAARPPLDLLVREGLAIERGGCAEPAHDRVRDRIVGLVGEQQRVALEQEVCARLALDPAMPLRHLPALAVPLARAAQDRRLVPIYRRWTDAHRAAGDVRSDRALARDLLGPRASEPEIRHLLRSRPLARRFGGWPVIAAAAALFIVGGWWAVAGYYARPAELFLASRPLALGGPGVGLAPAPVLEVRDHLHRIVRSASARVTMATRPPYHLTGDTSVAVAAGLATFPNVVLVAPDTVDSATFTFAAPGLSPLALTVPVSNKDIALSILRAHLGGRDLDPANPVLEVHASQSVDGVIDFDYTARWAAAAVMLGAVVTWRPGPAGVIAQLPLITPADHGRSELPIHFTAPARPGHYYLIFAYDAEPDAKWVASGTNWTLGHPIWGDSNDIARWSAAKLNEARHSGHVTNTVIYQGGRRTMNVPSRVVDIVIE